MDWSQWVYVCALAAVLAARRPHWLISVAMVANLSATLLFASFPLSVAIADAICGSVLMLGGVRAKAVGSIFAAMVILTVVCSWYGVQNHATYAIVDVLAYCQLIIIGGGGFGNVRRVRHAIGLDDRRGPNPIGGVARGGAPVPNSYFSVSER